MTELDISALLKDWVYVPGEFTVRKIKGADGVFCIQVRMDLGLMQVRWSGRPDGLRPHGCESLLQFHQNRRSRWERENGVEPFELSREDCKALSREATQYYWRRISFFELSEYARAERDALHNLGILDLCRECARDDEDRRMAEQYAPFVIAHRFQARAMGHLQQREFSEALREVDAGIESIQDYLRGLDRPDRIGDAPEIQFLRAWAEQIRRQRPRTVREQLQLDMEEAAARDQFETAARLRDRLLRLDVQQQETTDEATPGE